MVWGLRFFGFRGLVWFMILGFGSPTSAVKRLKAVWGLGYKGSRGLVGF